MVLRFKSVISPGFPTFRYTLSINLITNAELVNNNKQNNDTNCKTPKIPKYYNIIWEQAILK